MALYPHKSRRKRIETAATATLLWLTVAGIFGFFLYGQYREGGEIPVGNIFYLIGLGVFGLIGLISYVRRGAR